MLPHQGKLPTDGWVIAGIAALGALLLGVAVFGSPGLLIGGILGVLAVYVAYKEPMWIVLALAAWWPFEPFILKWIQDDLYVYARFASEIMVYVLVVVVLLGLLSGKYKQRTTSVHLPFILFAAMMLVSVILNQLPIVDAALGARQILRFMLLFFVVVYRYPRRFWIRRLLTVVFVILSIQSLLGIGQALTGGAFDSFLLPSARKTFNDIQLTEGTVQFWDPGQRVFGTFGRYDRLGTFVAMALLLAMGLLYESDKEPDWKWLAALAVVAIPALILTYSRSAWFGLVLGGLVIAAVRKDYRVFAGVGVVVVVLAGYLGVTGISSTLADVEQQTAAERLFEAFSYNRFKGEFEGLGRVYWLVKTPTQVVTHNFGSFLFGWGPAQTGGGAVAALSNTRVYDIVGEPFGVYGTEGYIDNNWFSLWGESGTLGMIFYLWLYVSLMVIAWQVARHSKDPLTRGLAAGYLGVAAAVALNASLATFLEIRTLAPYLWILGGSVVVLGSREHLILTRDRN